MQQSLISKEEIAKAKKVASAQAAAKMLANIRKFTDSRIPVTAKIVSREEANND